MTRIAAIYLVVFSCLLGGCPATTESDMSSLDQDTEGVTNQPGDRGSSFASSAFPAAFIGTWSGQIDCELVTETTTDAGVEPMTLTSVQAFPETVLRIEADGRVFVSGAEFVEGEQLTLSQGSYLTPDTSGNQTITGELESITVLAENRIQLVLLVRVTQVGMAADNTFEQNTTIEQTSTIDLTADGDTLRYQESRVETGSASVEGFVTSLQDAIADSFAEAGIPVPEQVSDAPDGITAESVTTGGCNGSLQRLPT